MAQGINKVFIAGNICAAPELRTTQGGTAVLNLRIATNESFAGKDGTKQERTEFHSVVVWGAFGEALSKFLTVGQAVTVEGSLRTSSYEKNGEKRYKTSIVAQSVVSARGGGEGGGSAQRPAAERSGAPRGKTAEQLPYRDDAPRAASAPRAAAQAPADDYDNFGGDDDIPF